MAYSGGKITAPITGTDIQQALGDSSNNVELLFKSDGINKWSRVKPIPHSNLFDVDFNTDLTAAKGLIWGMKPPIALPSDGLNINKMIKTTEVADVYPNWVYVPPKGGAEEPYRGSDFKGYNAAAQCPIALGITNYTRLVNLFDTDKLKFYLHCNPGTSDFPTIASFFGKLYNYHLVSEWYDNQGAPYYAQDSWAYKYKSDIALTEMRDNSYYYEVDVTSMENKSFDICMALQKYESGNYVAQSAILPPWTVYNRPFMMSVSFYMDFARQTKNFFSSYSTNTAISWRSSDDASTNPITMQGYSDLIIKFDVEQKDSALYVVRQNATGIPSNGKKVVFKAITAGEGAGNNQSAIGVPLDPTTRQTMSNGYSIINKGNGYQTIALNFPSVLKPNGTVWMIYIFYSTDGGQTWSNNPCASASVRITRAN